MEAMSISLIGSWQIADMIYSLECLGMSRRTQVLITNSGLLLLEHMNYFLLKDPEVGQVEIMNMSVKRFRRLARKNSAKVNIFQLVPKINSSLSNYEKLCLSLIHI